jgi:hypothetical protein
MYAELLISDGFIAVWVITYRVGAQWIALILQNSPLRKLGFSAMQH